MILPQFSCTARFEQFYRRIRGGDEFQDVPLNFSKARSKEILLCTLSVMSFFEPQTEPPPIYRSGRLQEEQRLVAKSCSFFWRILLPQCPNFAELESSKEAKSYHENPCNRITCKNLPPPSPRSTWIAVPGWGENKKRPLVRVFSDKRSSQRALLRPKGDVRGERNVPT